MNSNEVIENTNLRIDKDQDIIFCSVGLYKMFLANRGEGMEAKQLYDHLLFTARLQETNIIQATNTYLSKGLGWGQVKIKRAKTFLKKKGLISYVQRRGPSGKLNDVFIQVNFFRKEPRILEEYDPEAAGQLDLFGFMTGSTDSIPPAEKEIQATGTENDPPDGKSIVTGGMDSIPPDRNAIPTGGMAHRPAVDRTYGHEQQMLKERNKMLKERKRKESSPSLSFEAEEIQNAFIQYYSEKLKCKPASMKPEEIEMINEHVHRFGKLKTIKMLYSFFTDRDPNVSEFARKAGYRYKVFSSQIEALLQLKDPAKHTAHGGQIEEPPEVCPTCGKTVWKSTTGLRMCVNCRTMIQLVDGHWEVDLESLPQGEKQAASGE